LTPGIEQGARDFLDADIATEGLEADTLVAVPIRRLIGSILLGWDLLVPAVILVGAIVVGSVWSPFALLLIIPVGLALIGIAYGQFNRGFRFVLSRGPDGVRVGAGLTATVTETIPFGSLEEFFALSEESSDAYEYTVAWVDCTHIDGTAVRGLFSRGSHSADPALRPHALKPAFSVPLEVPRFVLNPFTLRLFNTLYYRLGVARSGRRSVHYAPFFFPLDSVMNWNRLYGRAGMYQYQCVVPADGSAAAIAALLHIIAASGQGSFLAVLKTFGDKPSPGMLSFPRAGTTLALDFRNRGAATLDLMARLDEVVRAAGGRLYPAKDGRMGAELFRSGYPRLAEFVTHVDPRFSSALWRRVGT